MPSEKRSWQDEDRESANASKRPRKDRDEQQSKDWRSVHLTTSSSKHKHDSRDGSRERRRDRSREREGHRSSRHRDDRHRSPSEHNSRHFDSKHHSSHRRDRSPSRKHGGADLKSAAVDAPGDEEGSEREEGEISPHPKTVKRSSPNVQPTSAPPIPEYDLTLEENPKEDDSAEARRARRAAILAKHQSQVATPEPSVTTPLHYVRAVSVVDATATPPITPLAQFAVTQPATPAGADFELEKGTNADLQAEDGHQQVGAADYDPDRDRREEYLRNAAKQDVEMEEEEEEVTDDEDVDDMFALDDDQPKEKKKKKVKKVKAKAVGGGIDAAADEEGYYQILLGETLDDGKYQVFSTIGKGMFSNVVRARVLGEGEGEGKEVAIKLVRSQESMYKAGLKEVQILQKIRTNDPEDKKHIVKLERTFEHRGHLCLVFESLSMNLRDVVKRFGRDVGINIRAVRAYAHQLFLALSLLRKANILHADIKPDNILVNANKSMLKLCDLGSATDISVENTATMITPYLVSRFYRAPEIILGMPYDMAVDTWSIGCTLYELYTGRILFPGRSNREMLRLMIEAKGRFNTKMVKKAKFADDYFDEMGAFIDIVDGAGGTGDVTKKIHTQKATRDMRARLIPRNNTGDALTADDKLLVSFVDLLEKCLMLDPARRLTPKEALNHPFIRP